MLKSIVFLSHLIMLNYFSYVVFVFVFQLLWSFCFSQLEEAETRPFRLTHAIPGASRSLDYNSQSTFEESGLANSMISVTWDWRTFCWGLFFEFLQLVELCIEEFWFVVVSLLVFFPFCYSLVSIHLIWW